MRCEQTKGKEKPSVNEQMEVQTQVADNAVQLSAENEALRAELAKRDADVAKKKEKEEAFQSLSQQYTDFPTLLCDIDALVAETDGISDLPPAVRYYVGYLMLKGQHALAAKDQEIGADKLLLALKSKPEILRSYLKTKKESVHIPRFSMDKSAGIRAIPEESPKNLTEARKAAIRYIKTR